MIRARSATMVNLRSNFSVLVIGLGLCIAPRVRAQNPPMNCTPDGIIEVCTTADSVAAPIATEPVPAPAAMVIYKDGLLSISAENVSLSDVLHEVSAKTGATIEFPNGSATEPVFTHIGPGPVRDILATLLNGTKFNYVMLGSQNTADGLQKIVLTPAGQTTEATEAAEVAQSEPPASLSPASTFSSRRGQLPLTAAQAAQRQADFAAQFEARKQEMMPILRQRYAEMMEKAAAARANEQSTASGSQAQYAGSDSQAQPTGSDSQAPPAGSDSQTQQ